MKLNWNKIDIPNINSVICDKIERENKITGCSAVGSARRSGRRGREFKSLHPDQIPKK